MSPLYLPLSVHVCAFNKPIAQDWQDIILHGRKPTFAPSEQQATAVKAFTDTEANIIIDAKAGTGKTSLMRLMIYARECARSASTTHVLGKMSVDAALNRPRVNQYKAHDHFDAIAPLSLKGHPAYKAVTSTAARLLGLVKSNLASTDPETLDELCTKYSVSITRRDDSDGGDDWQLMETVYELIPRLLEATKQDTRSQDFDDMLWLPVVLDLPMVKYDVLMVDESQDLNALQIELLLRSADRHVMVGDPNQAIYAFRGADAEAMATLAQRLGDRPEGCTVLPLTVTRRCPISVVTLAQQIVPNFQWAPDAEQGIIRTAPHYEEPEPGDMVLARTNAVLITGAFRCIATGIPARIQGRDIGAGLKRFILTVSNDKTSIIDMLDRLVAWQARENAKLEKARHAEDKIEALQDKMDCVLALTNGPDIDTVGQLCVAIDKLFDDTRPSTSFVLFSSVHRAKGLEADTVRILEPEKMPHPMATTESARKQEMNCLYVAITRPKRTLIFHGTPVLKLPEKPRSQACPTCYGAGQIEHTGQTDNMDVEIERCPRCGGTGRIKPIDLSSYPEPSAN